MKKKILVLVLVLFIFGLTSCGNKKVEIMKHDYFEKSMYTILELNEDEKNNINSYLDNYYIETSEVSGFSRYESEYNLDLLNNCLELALNCNDSTSFDMLYKMVYDKVRSIDVCQIDNGYNLYCYISIMKKCELPIKEEFYNLINNYFDNENQLFFYNGKNDLEEIKLSMTINFYSILKDDSVFSLRYKNILQSKIQNMYDSFDFLLPDNNKSLYNSGGRIIAAAKDILDKCDFSEKIDWYKAWKKSIGNIEDSISASNYCDFVDIMSIFEEAEYFALEDYLNRTSNFNLDADLQCLSKISKYIDITKYDFYANLHLPEYIGDIKLVKENIDIENTYYACLLASYTNYELNLNKLNKLISIYYDMINTENSIDKLSHYIYFTTGLDICMNKKITCDINMLEQKINYVLNSAVSRSVDCRKVVEVASVISIFKPLNISEKDFKKINEQIEKIFSVSNNLNNTLCSDLLILTYDLVGSIDVLTLNKLKDNLYCDGGYKASTDDSEADIISTYMLYKLSPEAKDDKFILENVEYVNRLKKDEGIYSYSLSDSSVSLVTIWYGNIIANTRLGVDDNGIKY